MNEDKLLRSEFLRTTSNENSSAESKFYHFTAAFLKSKSRLVPTRLALKRKRANLRTTNTENSSNFDAEKEQIDFNELNSVASPSHNASMVFSQAPSRLRNNTPFTAAKPLPLSLKDRQNLQHPVTGENVEIYVEQNGNPSPCSYVLPRKPLREKNYPTFSFGSRCLVEKEGGSSRAWQKQWFAHSDPFTTKVDFSREENWPTPVDYSAPTSLGLQVCKVTFPAWSMTGRTVNDPHKSKDITPSPLQYDAASAFGKLTEKTSKITMKSRTGGTKLSDRPIADFVPGPGAHDQKHFLSNKISAPKYSFGKRWPISLGHDPYVNMLPNINS